MIDPIYPHIEHRNGRAVVAGTRIWVVCLWALWVRGEGDLTVDQIHALYPHLSIAQVLTALAYAKDHEGEMEREAAEDRAQFGAMGER